MIKIYYAILVLLPIHAVLAEAYRWTDSSGIIHFGDSPKNENAIKIELKQPSLSIPPVQESHANTDGLGQKEKVSDVVNYRVDIIKPKDGETFHDAEGNVQIVVATVPIPSDKKTFSYRYLLNGQQIAEGNQQFLQLSGIDRGTYQIMVMMFDDKGSIVANSGQVTFFLHKPFIKKQTKN